MVVLGKSYLHYCNLYTRARLTYYASGSVFGLSAGPASA